MADSDTRKKCFKDAINNVEECAKMVIANTRGDERDQYLQELENSIKGYCKLDNNWKVQCEAIKQIEKDFLSKGGEEVDIGRVDKEIDETFESLVNNKIVESQSLDCTKHSWYREYKEKVETLLSNDRRSEDDEIVVRSENLTQLDPLTKQPIKEGVRNKKCGHIYERVPIISVLKKKKEMRCPCIGCDVVFKQSDLE